MECVAYVCTGRQVAASCHTLTRGFMTCHVPTSGPFSHASCLMPCHMSTPCHMCIMSYTRCMTHAHAGPRAHIPSQAQAVLRAGLMPHASSMSHADIGPSSGHAAGTEGGPGRSVRAKGQQGGKPTA